MWSKRWADLILRAVAQNDGQNAVHQSTRAGQSQEAQARP